MSEGIKTAIDLNVFLELMLLEFTMEVLQHPREEERKNHIRKRVSRPRTNCRSANVSLPRHLKERI